MFAKMVATNYERIKGKKFGTDTDQNIFFKLLEVWIHSQVLNEHHI